MPPFVYKLIGAAVALALLIGGAWWVQHTIRTLEAEKATLEANHEVDQQALRNATTALDEINKQHSADMAAIVADAETAKAQSASGTKIIKEIHNVPIPVIAPGSCPGDPAFDLELDRLRERGAGGSPGPSGDQGHGPGTPSPAGGPSHSAGAEPPGHDLLRPAS